MKAKQLLGNTDGLAVTERQYFKQRPSVDEVKAVAAKVPGGIRAMLSTRSRRYKELALADRELNDEEIAALLAEEPGLWRRPIIVRDDEAVVGFDSARLHSLLS